VKILLVGTGSIAKRHLKNLKKIQPDVDFYVYSRSNRTLPNTKAVKFEELNNRAYNLIIIASDSDKHDSDLELVLKLKARTIFLEKPASLDLQTAKKLEYEIEKEKVNVRIGYDLRYHEGIKYLKEKFHDEILLDENIIIFSQVGQNLSTWRKPRKDFEAYSFNQSRSGGVINDLSHELDFINYISNTNLSFSQSTFKSKFFNEHLEDIAIVSANSKDKNILAYFELNCISHSFYRGIKVHTKNKTYCLNLLNGTYSEFCFGKMSFQKVFNNNRDTRYESLWTDLIEGSSILPTYAEAIKLLNEIQ